MKVASRRPGRVTHRQVAYQAAAADVQSAAAGEKAKTALDTSALAIEAVTTVGTEWRAFAEMTFWQRAVWLFTGQGPHVKRSEEHHAEVQASVRSERVD